jgi:glucose-6-phosphate isomerase
MPRPTELPAWKQLAALASTPRGECAIAPIDAAGLYADFSRQSIDAPVCEALLSLASGMELAPKREALFAGAIVNVSEQRPALHTALRADGTDPLLVAGTDIRADIRDQIERLGRFSEAIRQGKRRGISDQRFTDVVAIGIGGSLLGPEMVCAALAQFADGPRVRFVSNVDGAHLADTLAGLNPATTLITVTSKTFTTDETLTNAASVRAWLTARLGEDAFRPHFVAITANAGEARRQGYADDAIFEFRDWVGGRFSLWSTAGLPIALALGAENFAQLRAGAKAMDTHFQSAPMAANLPIMLALAGIWNRNFLGMASHAVLPYAQRLSRLPAHLQQLEMESNGKSVDVDGRPVDYATCPVIFGEAGTNGQHSFHQLLHQGADRIPADIVLIAQPESLHHGHHDKLLANALAQADALWQGFAHPERHRVHQGGRPVTLLVMPKLDPAHLGALIALYEHKVFVQGVIWNVNSFDQWGVELGKTIAKALLPVVSGHSPAPAHLQSVINRLRGR